MNYLNLNKIALSENFYRFVASAALHMLTKYMVGGIKINIQNMDLPIQVGLSSSACISVLVVRSFNKIYNLGLSKKQEMEAAYKSEFYTGSRCGKLDQLVALNKSALLAKFNKKSITIKDIKIRNDLDIIVVKFNGNKKNTIKILKDLSSAFPFPKNHQSKLAFNALGKDNQLIVNKAMDYLATGNNKQIGRLMNKAQSIFDKKLAPLSPQQLTAPTFHRFINDKIIKKNIHGAK
ncbi:hypothetical protein FACS1894166_06210 [Bacilli bacterium]|nr:hypothetical protein FACS1894166_06210 [Bacilli bacterium]